MNRARYWDNGKGVLYKMEKLHVRSRMLRAEDLGAEKHFREQAKHSNAARFLHVRERRSHPRV